jgi:hypothetical protein
MKTKAINFKDFTSGSYKETPKKQMPKLIKRIGLSTVVPFAVMAHSTMASTTEAIPAGATAWVGEQSLSLIAHMLDPVIQILVALSFPVASVIIVGACFHFMFNNSEKAWSMIQSSALGYVLIQISPLILNVLKDVGSAM